jgi:hypothetical protein
LYELWVLSHCFFVAHDLVHGVVALDERPLIVVFTLARKDFLKEKM